jgi:hypothetical protein
MKRVKYIYHNGRQLLFLDFSACNVQDFTPIIEEAEKLIRSEPPASVLTLTDVTAAKYNLEITQKLKEFVKSNKPYVKAGAVVGLDPLKKIIYNGVMHFSGRNLVAFDDIEKAKDWLADQWKAPSNRTA